MLCRTYQSWQDFFLGSAVLGQYGHSVALEMAGMPTSHSPCQVHSAPEASEASLLLRQPLLGCPCLSTWCVRFQLAVKFSTTRSDVWCRCHEECRRLSAGLQWGLVSILRFQLAVVYTYIYTQEIALPVVPKTAQH